ncbi:MAG: hypothetical protein GC178_06165 [Flavobacteriales bacterium]|nr:hypothetical protein [Flavobacteriales bacterium]
MKSIRDVIADIWANEVDNTLNQLEDFGFLGDVNHVVDSVQSWDGLDITYVEALASSTLTKINTKLSQLDFNEKRTLRYTIGNIMSRLFVLLMAKSQVSQAKLGGGLAKTLKTTCKLHNWNYDELVKEFQHEVAQFLNSQILSPPESKEITHSSTYYYKWTGDRKGDLVDLAVRLKDNGIIKSQNEFQKLFTNTSKGNLSVRTSKEHRDLVLVLFDELKTAGLIAWFGHRAKHFTPLKARFVDFEGNQLIQVEVRRLMFAIRKNSTKHAELKRIVHSWTNGFKDSR